MKRVQSRLRFPVSAFNCLSISAIVLATMGGQAIAQNNLGGVGEVFLTAPFVAASGEHVLTCVADFAGFTAPNTNPNSPSSVAAASEPSSGAPLTVTLSLLNGVTGALLSSQQVTLQPLGTLQFPPVPCLEYVVAPAAFTTASSSFIAEVALNPQPVPPRVLPPGILSCFPSNPCGPTLTTSLEIYTPDANGNPTGVHTGKYFPPVPCFEPAGTTGCKLIGQAGVQGLGGLGEVFLTAPFVAATGEHVLSCAANFAGLTAATAPPLSSSSSVPAADPPPSGATLPVTLSLLDGVTGALLSSTQVALQPLGSAPEPPDPCIEFVVAPGSASVNNSYIGVVAVNPQPLPPGFPGFPIPGVGVCFPPDPCSQAVRTSLQIFTPDPNGNPTSVRGLEFFPPAPCFEAEETAGCRLLPAVQH